MKIIPGVAVGAVKFGDTGQAVETALGKPQSVSKTEDDEIEWLYEKLGLSLYFEGATPRLTSVLVESPAATLFGERIVSMQIDRFIAVVKQNGGTVEISDLSDDEGTFLIVPEMGLFVNIEDTIVASVVVEAAAEN